VILELRSTGGCVANAA